MENFPLRLKDAMKARGYKAIDLSNLTNIDRGTISYYLSGKFKPKAKNILLIAEALKVNVPWLLGDEEVPMDMDPSVDYYVTEDDVYTRAYLKLEYSDVVQMNVSREEWNVLFDKFENVSDKFKTDILKYMYLVFAMDEMIKIKSNKDDKK